MKVELISSTSGMSDAVQFGMTVLLNDHTALDAGTLGFLWPIDRQRNVRHVFLSHSHIDHVASLPAFLDNVYGSQQQCPTVFAGPETLHSLKTDVFNDRLWPDFIRLSNQGPPFVQLKELMPFQTCEVSDLRITPIPLNHVVPTYGFLVEDDRSSVAFITDTQATEAVWETVNSCKSLKAVFLECSFPRRCRALARQSGHLSVDTFSRETNRLRTDVPVIAYHLKPAFCEEIMEEIAGIASGTMSVVRTGHPYQF